MDGHKKNINCRVCLRYDLKETHKCFSLFEKFGSSLITDKIKYVANIVIRQSDGLPDKICPDCMLQLETAIQFKQKCVTSNKILRSIVQKPSTICKVTFRPIKNEIEGVLDDSAHQYCCDSKEVQTEVTTLMTVDLCSKSSKTDLIKSEKIVTKDCSTSDTTYKKPKELIENNSSDFCNTKLNKPDDTTDNYSNNTIQQVQETINDNGAFSDTNSNEQTKTTDDHYTDFSDSEDKPLVETTDTPCFDYVGIKLKTTDTTREHSEDQTQEKETEQVIKKSKAIDLKLKCEDCGGSFKSKCKLAVHWKKVHLPTKLVCPKCKRTFKTYKAFNMHAKRQTRSCEVSTKVRIEGQGKSRIFYCKECDYKTKRIKDMDAHLATHTGDRRFQCRDCFKCFTQHSSLQGHRETHHKDYRVETTCHYCGKHIQGRSKYYKHLRIHQSKSAECEVCKKMFKNKTSLMTHMKRHSGVKSYTCEKCSANFYTASELCNHRKRVHFKSRSFNCDLCEYSMYTANALRMHRSRHELNNVVCLVCGTFVESEEKLVLHHKRHTEKNYSCQHCDKSFFLKDSLRRHIIKVHKNFVVPIKQESNKTNTIKIKQEHPANKCRSVRTISPT